MKQITLILTLLMTLTLVAAVESGNIRCETTDDCVDKFGEDFVCVVGQNNQNICIEAEGKMVVPEFTGVAIIGVVVVGAGALYALKKKKA